MMQQHIDSISRMEMKVVVYGGVEDSGLLFNWWFGMDERRKI